MFEYIFSTNKSSHYIKHLDSAVPSVKKLAPLMWGEHCMECSAPYCYKTCLRYKSRADGHCERFIGGITPVEINGHVAAKARFKSWSKLETRISPLFWDRTDYLKFYRLYLKVGLWERLLSPLLPGNYIKSKFYAFVRKLLGFSKRRIQSDITNAGRFVCTFLNKDHPTKLLLDQKLEDSSVCIREAIELPLGQHRFSTDIDLEKIKMLALHPADPDEEVEIIIADSALIPQEEEKKKVKCLIWDLDNTIWDGVLIEDKHAPLRQNLIRLIRNLDKKGIVHSIASKNDETQARAYLKECGIDDLFVFTKINWDPKSVNIKRTLQAMNINANSVVFIDDNPFEREEVSSSIPNITCIDPSEIEEYVQTERFRVSTSAESSGRKETYRMLERLLQDKEEWVGNIDSFLLSCNINVDIDKPKPTEVDRCYELLQRTNQLNASGRRLNKEEIIAKINDETCDCLVLRSGDKYGSYGIVGVMFIEKEEICTITDFVISCRVANKKIEATLINYLSKQYGGQIMFMFKKTKLNGPMKKVIDDLAMTLYQNQNECCIYCHKYSSQFPRVVTIRDHYYASNHPEIN